MRIYISGALMGSANVAMARERYERIAVILNRHGFQCYLPHQHTDPVKMAALPPYEVFRRDEAALLSGDAVVAFLDEPSLGVGAEVAIAVANGRPVIGLCHEQTPVSRFLIGLIETGRVGTIIRYKQLEDSGTAIIECLNRASTGQRVAG